MDSEIKSYPLCLGNTSKDFAFDSMIKTELNRKVYNFSVTYETIDVSDIEAIRKYLMKKQGYYINAWIHSANSFSNGADVIYWRIIGYH